MDELKQQQLRYYRLVNGLLAVVYLSGFCWVLAQVYNMIF